MQKCAGVKKCRNKKRVSCHSFVWGDCHDLLSMLLTAPPSQHHNKRLNCCIIAVKLLLIWFLQTYGVLPGKWERGRVARCSLFLKPHCATLGKGEGNYSRQFATSSGTSWNHTAWPGEGGDSFVTSHSSSSPCCSINHHRKICPNHCHLFTTWRFFTTTMLTH